MIVHLATTEQEIRRVFPVMRQLRPKLDAESFVDRVRRQQEQGYHLAVLETGARVAAVAGYRIGENLAWGRFLYVDDLVTDAATRSKGCGSHLLQWLERTAEEAGCDELHLDSGVQRFAAHRFYLTHRMRIASHHFSIKLRAE